jgi:hypothetical protein
MCICTYRCIRHATSDVILKAGLALWVTVTTRPFRSLRICPNPVSERYGDVTPTDSDLALRLIWPTIRLVQTTLQTPRIAESLQLVSRRHASPQRIRVPWRTGA